MVNMQLDARQVAKDFGGTRRLARLLTDYGMRITPNGIEKWVARKRIPSPWLVALSVIARNESMRFQLDEYAIEETA